MKKKLSLKSFKADNFKNLDFSEKAELKNLNVLIGPNGSGKSNFISCLKFLKGCVSSAGENQSVSGFQKSVSEMGGSGILDKAKEASDKVSFQYEFFSNAFESDVILDIKLTADRSSSHVLIWEESLYYAAGSIYKKPFFLYKSGILRASQVLVYNDDGSRSTHLEKLSMAPVSSLGLVSITELLENTQFSPEQTPVYKVRREIIDSVSKWRFYNSNDMSLNEIRLSEPKIGPRDIFLSSNGDNLALVLDNLILEYVVFDDILNRAMKSILPQTYKVRPLRTGRLSLNVEWYFEGTKEPFYLDEMSDGTVRMLCWAIVLLSPVRPELLVIEEPELGLHVSWMPILAEWIKIASARSQVFVSTHSPDLLDHFTDELENVFCFNSLDQKRFSMERLSRELFEDKLEEGWELGDLYRTGDPGVGGWSW